MNPVTDFQVILFVTVQMNCYFEPHTAFVYVWAIYFTFCQKTKVDKYLNLFKLIQSECKAVITLKLTWVLSKKVAQQSCVCPVEYILNTHTVWDLSTEALSDVLGQKVSVRVPLTIRHQEQHPHKSHVGCITNKYRTLESQNVLHWILVVM